MLDLVKIKLKLNEMITPKNLVKHELIGLHVEVVLSTNPANIGIKGNVIDETKNMLIIRTNSTNKKIQKKNSKFIFTLSNGEKVRIDGKILALRPEDRIKLKMIK